MSAFLRHLARRAIAPATIRPRLTSRFEPTPKERGGEFDPLEATGTRTPGRRQGREGRSPSETTPREGSKETFEQTGEPLRHMPHHPGVAEDVPVRPHPLTGTMEPRNDFTGRVASEDGPESGTRRGGEDERWPSPEIRPADVRTLIEPLAEETLPSRSESALGRATEVPSPAKAPQPGLGALQGMEEPIDPQPTLLDQSSEVPVGSSSARPVAARLSFVQDDPLREIGTQPSVVPIPQEASSARLPPGPRSIELVDGPDGGVFPDRLVALESPPGRTASVVVRPLTTRLRLHEPSPLSSPDGHRETEDGAEVPPNVTVTIGRIEVRAIAPQSDPAPVRRPKSTVMTLEDYLRRRGGNAS